MESGGVKEDLGEEIVSQDGKHGENEVEHSPRQRRQDNPGAPASKKEALRGGKWSRRSYGEIRLPTSSLWGSSSIPWGSSENQSPQGRASLEEEGPGRGRVTGG